MANVESSLKPAEETLQSISDTFSFSTFVHFRVLADTAKDIGATPNQWQELMDNWQYEPSMFLAANKRGNCVDFAHYGQVALRAAAINAHVIGSRPSSNYTKAQQTFMRFRHTSLITSDVGTPVMFEPGWKIPQGIPLLPANRQIDTGSWKFKTLSFGQNLLTQETSSPTGLVWNRHFNLQPLQDDEIGTLTKSLLRVPRKIDMITRLSPGVPHHIIGYNPKSDTLTSDIDCLPNSFEISDLTPSLNERISEWFGYDVKEELVASLGLLKALPQEYWIP